MREGMTPVPVRRRALRLWLGTRYFRARRWVWWRLGGVSFARVVKTTCFLAEMTDFAAFNSVYEKYFTGKPARSCVAVKQLPKNVLVEVEVIAAAE